MTDLLSVTRLAGLAGAALAAIAYVPQISHLFRERCTAGISGWAFGLWLISSLLVGSHAVASGNWVFTVLSATQVAATSVILMRVAILRGARCETHAARAQQSPHPADRQAA